MEGWMMIHKIKAMYDNGNGYSIARIAEELSISRNTVKKYLKMNEEQINEYLKGVGREKLLDKYRDYIIELLQRYPKLTASKIKRKLVAKGIGEEISDRTFRNYVRCLKEQIAVKQERYYEPVIDMVAGVQCQVDLGEVRDVIIGDNVAIIYFIVFVLSYSRLMYVGVSDRPINTSCFIRLHDEAFRYFDGVVEECVYDQTKLVAIREEFREVWFNEEFYRYATFSGFDIRVCEGYDPESKGKVESGVKYVKNDFFYGEKFIDFNDLTQSLREWLDKVANERVHGTTKRRPRQMYDEQEYEKMKPYSQPFFLKSEDPAQSRQVDKTSLISYRSNKYSVPMKYQSSTVAVKEEDGKLIIRDMESQEVIAIHNICEERGRIIKNSNHYRDHDKLVTDREDEVAKVIGRDLATRVCKVIKETSPKIYKDQLVGLIKVLNQYTSNSDLAKVLDILASRRRLTVSFIKEYLEAFYSNRQQVEEDKDKGSIGILAQYKCLIEVEQ